MDSKTTFFAKRKSGKTNSVEFVREYSDAQGVNRAFRLYKKDDKGKDIEQSARLIVCSFNFGTRLAADTFADVENLLD